MVMREKIFELIKNCDVAFLGSVDEDGYPNQKAVSPPRKTEGDNLYFTTTGSSLRTEQYQKNNKASVYFYRKEKFKYEGVMLIGTMRVLTDEQTKHAVWRCGDSVLFKNGPSDTNYCVLCFTAQKCRYYADLRSQWVKIL